MRDDRLIDLAEWLVEKTAKMGADEVEVSISHGKGFDVEIRNGEIESLVEAGEKSLSLRVFLDHRYASLSSNDFDKEVLQQMVARAIERAKNSSQDIFNGLPDYEGGKDISDWRQLEIYDDKFDELRAEQKIELAKKTEKIALSDERIKRSYGSSFSDSNSEFILVNSKGFKGSYKKTSYSLGVYLQAGDDENRVEDGWYESSRLFSDLWTPEQVAQKAVHRVTRMINPRKIPSKNVPVILEPGAARSILSFLFTCITGRAIYMKQSFLVDKIGEEIASRNVTLVDDGLIKRGMASRPFDREGVPVRKKVVVENGVLNTYLTNAYSARKLKMKNTGNASGANNFYLKAGDKPPEEIIKSVNEGLLISHFMGQGTNPVTGDFSRGAFGLWIENGEVAFPVSEITVSGNLARMLKSIEMIGNDLRFDHSIVSPTIKISEMTVSGV